MFSLLLAVIYLAFVSLGLPDSLLGSAWPAIYPELGVPVSWAGGISMIIAGGTIFSSLQSDRLTRRLGTGRVTAFSVALTAAALFGFSVSGSFWQLCLWAVPYGLGAGSVDAALNNYVAVHYASRHMSWLHCMWGVGASVGPSILGFAMAGGGGWTMGYRYISLLQVALSVMLFASLPLWRGRGEAAGEEGGGGKPLTIPEILRIPGTKAVMLTFFCYCALENTAILWSSSYLALHRGIPAERAAAYASLFFIGITAGRAASGFLTIRFSDCQMIRMGQGIIAAGAALVLLPIGERAALGGLLLVGLGCAPIYPCVIHSTPFHFGADKSQAIIGVQMASAYVGTCLMPTLFGVVASRLTIALFPVYLLGLLALMAAAHRRLVRVCGA